MLSVEVKNMIFVNDERISEEILFLDGPPPPPKSILNQLEPTKYSNPDNPYNTDFICIKELIKKIALIKQS